MGWRGGCGVVYQGCQTGPSQTRGGWRTTRCRSDHSSFYDELRRLEAGRMLLNSFVGWGREVGRGVDMAAWEFRRSVAVLWAVPAGENQDEIVRRRLREDVGGRRDLGGIAAVQCLVQVTDVIGWCLLRFLLWGLRGVSMEKVLMERCDWDHFEDSLYNSSGRLKYRTILGRGLEKGLGMRTELASHNNRMEI